MIDKYIKPFTGVKIAFTSKDGDDIVLRDVELGKEYDAVCIGEGKIDPKGMICEHDTLAFIDDVGDTVCIWAHDETFEVVA